MFVSQRSRACGSLVTDDEKSHQVGGKIDEKFMNMCLTSP